MLSEFFRGRLVIAASAAIIATSFSNQSVNAAIVPFFLQGKAGLGLLGGNENQANPVVGGSGGIIGQGIFFDDVTRNLTINVGWGSGNGFVNMTGAVQAMHIHGPTASSGSASFNENAGVLIGLDALPGFNNSATNGGLQTVVNIPVANVASLLNGSLYLNAHTVAFGGGEIRGNLVAVPEPSSIALLSIAGAAGFGRRLWRKRFA